MKKTIFVFTLTLLLVLPIAVKAFSVEANDNVYIGKNETVDGNLYAAGMNIMVDGKVAGDVICAGQTITINGEVSGDVICAGQSININGKIGGNLRVAGNSINISSQIERNAMAFGALINLSQEGKVGWDAMLVGASVDIRGNVGKDLYGSASKLNINGEIGKNVRFRIEDKEIKKSAKSGDSRQGLIIGENAKVNGDLVYTSTEEYDISDEAKIGGEVIHNFPKASKRSERPIIFSWAWANLYSIFSSLVVGLVLISLWREGVKNITDLMLNKIGGSIGRGALILILTPIAAVLLLFTVIAIPLALILFVIWLITLFLSKILVGILIGRTILNNLWPKQKDSLIWAMIIGILVTYLIFSLPFIGWALSLVATLWGLGGLMIYFKERK